MLIRAPALRRCLWLGALALAAAGGGWLVSSRHGSADAALLAAADEVCVVAPPLPHDPASGLGLHAARPVPPQARCPVCGMFPARSPEWAAQVVFQDGATQFFDSPLSLFTYLQDVGRYTAGRQASEIAAWYVSDAASGGWINAHSAFYVSGSSALGPMRAGNLPAFSSEAVARQFASRRGGAVLAASQLGPVLLRSLHGARHHAHAARTR